MSMRMQSVVRFERISGMTRVRYGEGTAFVVPLRNQGVARGLVARSNPDGVLFGYFFGPRMAEPPRLQTFAELAPEDAVLVGKFGHLGLRGGTWPVLGPLPGWDRGRWAMPALVRYEELTGRTFHVFYDDGDPNHLLREERVQPGRAEQGPKDGLMGAGHVEKRLINLLA
jgi:hypothetical protein